MCPRATRRLWSTTPAMPPRTSRPPPKPSAIVVQSRPLVSVVLTTGADWIGSGFTGRVGGPGSGPVSPCVSAAASGVGPQVLLLLLLRGRLGERGVHVRRRRGGDGRRDREQRAGERGHEVVRWGERVVSTVASWAGVDWSRGKLR